ncbi:MAG: hypothetical protein HY774_27950 [Acidobacteria bacterium]|nr:hypothetical protein [Acidobacteriota bacterium]
MPRQQRVTLVCLLIFFGCAASLYPVQKSFDTTRGEELPEEILYMSSGETIKRLSMGFDSLVSDIYWIRTVQYFGRKFTGTANGSGNQQADKLNKDYMPLLAPLLDIVVTLDPKQMSAFSYGSNFLSEVDAEASIALLKRGIAELKRTSLENIRFRFQITQMYQQTAYTYWRMGKYQEAADTYREASQYSTNPPVMRAMEGAMRAQSNDRSTAYTMFEQMKQQAIENNEALIADTADWRIRHLLSLDQRDFLNRMLTMYKQRTGTCATSWSQMIPLIQQHLREAKDSRTPSRTLEFSLNQKGDILDTGTNPKPYMIEAGSCQTKLSSESEIPSRWDPAGY